MSADTLSSPGDAVLPSRSEDALEFVSAETLKPAGHLRPVTLKIFLPRLP